MWVLQLRAYRPRFHVLGTFQLPITQQWFSIQQRNCTKTLIRTCSFFPLKYIFEIIYCLRCLFPVFLFFIGSINQSYIFLFSRSPTADPQVARKLCWLPSKLLHGYYQNMVEDRLCVERVLSGCLVPVSLKTQDRMKRFLSLYTHLDEPAIG